jgi:fructose-bisphosphate aldolase class II
MTLTTIVSALRQAQQGGYALPLFDTFDLNSTEGILQALEAKRAPGIIAIYAGLFEQPHGPAFLRYIRARAAAAAAPVAVMLDHGRSFEQCLQALQAGCTDVMFDGSRLPFAENLAISQQVARAAHALGAGAEAELGHVGLGTDYQDFGAQKLGFTDPLEAGRFAAETQVDSLAVAIGTAHGVYAGGEPCLDLELLKAIRAQVATPLALHGGSGCSADQFRQAIAGGIAKVNIATDLYLTAARRLAEAASNRTASYFGLSQEASEAFRDRCSDYLELFGAAGKG